MFGDFHAVTLGQAAGSDQKLAVAFFRSQFAQRVERFFFGGADESTGIDDQHGGLSGFFDKLVAVLDEQLRHRIRVDGILGAAERDEMECFARHTDKIPYWGVSRVGRKTKSFYHKATKPRSFVVKSSLIFVAL